MGGWLLCTCKRIDPFKVIAAILHRGPRLLGTGARSIIIPICTVIMSCNSNKHVGFGMITALIPLHTPMQECVDNLNERVYCP